MVHHVLARERFEKTRAAIRRLDDVHLAIMLEGEDWKPQQLHVHAPGTSDPTASRAIYRADNLADIMQALHAEERELTDYIGVTLRLLENVRKGLGDKYANVLEARYIDGWQWDRITDEYDIKRPYGHYLIDVACDWIDSIGIQACLRGEYDV